MQYTCDYRPMALRDHIVTHEYRGPDAADGNLIAIWMPGHFVDWPTVLVLVQQSTVLNGLALASHTLFK